MRLQISISSAFCLSLKRKGKKKKTRYEKSSSIFNLFLLIKNIKPIINKTNKLEGTIAKYLLGVLLCEVEEPAREDDDNERSRCCSPAAFVEEEVGLFGGDELFAAILGVLMTEN